MVKPSIALIRPRLEASGADIDRVHVVSAIATGNGNRRSFNLTHDVAKLEKSPSTA